MASRKPSVLTQLIVDALRRSVFNTGVRLRNRKINDKLRFLHASQHWSLDQLRKHQLDELRKLLVHAYKHSSFYRERIDSSGIDPLAIRSIDDLSKIPVTEKSDLLNHRDAIQNRASFKKLFYSETSGSTGEPLVFYRSDDWDAWHNASVMRGCQWHGVSLWERNGYLWGFNLDGWKRWKTRLLDLLQSRFRMFSYDERELREFVGQLRSASFVGGYSSMIYQVAKFINEQSDVEPVLNLKMVKGTSEKILPSYQVAAQQAFGQQIISEYGAAEAGIIAFECEQGVSHVNMETCIVETDNDQILVTNLYSHSFPVIRYRLGDIVKTASGPCKCGRQHTHILEVTGRIGQSIRGKTRDFPSLTLYYIFKNLAEQGLLLNYAATQDRVGSLELRVEQSVNSAARSLLDIEICKYFEDDLHVVIVDQCDLQTRDRKFRDFVSKVDDANEASGD